MLKGQAGPLRLVFLAACFRLCASLQAPGQPLGALLRRDNLSAQALLQASTVTCLLSDGRCSGVAVTIESMCGCARGSRHCFEPPALLPLPAAHQASAPTSTSLCSITT
jgi:hypothetical protein